MTLREMLTPEIIERYKVTIQVGEDWVMYRSPQYSPTEPSRQESRFNSNDECAFYVASGTETAQSEVRNWQECSGYTITSGCYTAFDLQKFAEEHNCTDVFVRSADDSGYRICQEVAQIVTGADPAISGVIFPSSRAHRAGRRGTCMALLPHDGHLPDGFFAPDAGG